MASYRLELSSAALGQPAGDFTVSIQPPLDLPPANYSVALAGCAVWNTAYNVSPAFGNQRFTFYIDGSTVLEGELRPGAYLADDLIDAIGYQMDLLTGTLDNPDPENRASSLIRIAISQATLGFVLQLSADTMIDFSAGGTSNLYLNFGADPVQYIPDVPGDLVYLPRQADITNGVTSYLVHCSLATSLYNGASSQILYSFVPEVIPGGLFVDTPASPQYVALNQRFISNCSIKVTDHLGRIIDFSQDPQFQNNGSTVTLVIRRDA